MPSRATSRSPSNAPNHRARPDSTRPALGRHPSALEDEAARRAGPPGCRCRRPAADCSQSSSRLERREPYAVRRVRGRRHRRRGEVDVALDVPAVRGPGLGVAAGLRKPIARWSASGNSSSKRATQRSTSSRAGRRRHEQEVAPPEGRVGLGAHDEVVAVVGDGRALQPEQVEVGDKAGTVDAHAPILPPSSAPRRRDFGHSTRSGPASQPATQAPVATSARRTRPPSSTGLASASVRA